MYVLDFNIFSLELSGSDMDIAAIAFINRPDRPLSKGIQTQFPESALFTGVYY
jgi:hypothetical protein